MSKEFEYTCKTQKEFVQMVSEHKTGFKFCQDADYEIHILYKNNEEFHLTANKIEGTFVRTGIKAGVISTTLEEIHFGNIAELELSVQKFNILAFWEAKSKNDPKAAIVFEFISEMIDKTKTDKYYSNDFIVCQLRGFKICTGSNFNLLMCLNLHYIENFSFDILCEFSEYMKNQYGYVAPSEQEVTSMTTKTTVYPNAFLSLTAEEIQKQFNFKSVKVVSTIASTTITIKLLKIDCYKLYNLHEKIVGNINYSTAEVKILNSAFSELYIHSDFDKYPVINPACCFEVSESRCDKGITTIHMTYINPAAINQNDKTDNDINKNGKTDTEKSAFIKSAKTADKIKLITHLSVENVVYDNDKELTKVFIHPQIHSDFVQFTNDINPVDLLTREYNTDAAEKKAIQKLLTDFVKTYRNKTKDVHQSLTHSNIQVCITVEDNKYIVLKKFNLTIFDIIKIDGLSALHTALEKSLLLSSQDTTSAAYVTEIIAEINSKIIATDDKPIIRNLREFKKLLYSCRGKATAKRCTYNKSNITNFISGYVIAAYNNRLPKYTAFLKPSKNK